MCALWHADNTNFSQCLFVSFFLAALFVEREVRNVSFYTMNGIYERGDNSAHKYRDETMKKCARRFFIFSLFYFLRAMVCFRTRLLMLFFLLLFFFLDAKMAQDFNHFVSTSCILYILYWVFASAMLWCFHAFIESEIKTLKLDDITSCINEYVMVYRVKMKNKMLS